MTCADRNVIAYFAGWRMEEENVPFDGEVAGLPWDSLTYVNHAFWCVEPVESPEETSFQRRDAGKPARENFRVVPMAPHADLEDRRDSRRTAGLPRNHFAQYAEFTRRYPDVTVLISIGGWTRCGYFSEMAFTPKGRSSFIASCMAVLERYPWLGGFDIDWEYPASGDRRPDPNEPDDQGCPMFGTYEDDRVNFAKFLAEFREALEEKYGKGGKKLTACACASVDWTLPNEDWGSAAPSLDSINIMTYDLAGAWGGHSGHASSPAQAAAAAEYFQGLGIPMNRICIGSPLYGTAMKLRQITGAPLGAPVEPGRPNRQVIDQNQLLEWEAQAVSGYRIEKVDGKYVIGQRFAASGTGWHMGYDETDGGPWLYNDDPASPHYRWFVSYENPLSLQRKLDYIREQGIGGIIVWESDQDAADYRMLKQMYTRLIQK